MSDWSYTLGLDAKPFVAGAKEAKAAEQDMAQTIKSDAAAVTTAVRQEAAAMGEVKTAVAQAAGPMKELSAAAGAAASQLQASAGKIQTTSAHLKEIGSAGQAAKGGLVNAGQGMLNMSYAVQDVQYGLKGIMNNVPSIVQSLGGSAGLAGGVGIALVALQGLASYIGNEFAKAWEQVDGTAMARDLAVRSEALAEEHKRKLARLVGESGQKGDREAEGVSQMLEANGKSRGRDAEKFEAKKAAMAAAQELAKEQANGITNVAEKAKALNEMEKRHAAEKLDAEKAFYAERLNNLKATTGFTGNRHEDEKRLRKLQEEKRAIDLMPEDERSEKTKRRAAEIDGSISAEKARVDYARSAYDSDSAGLRRVEEAIKLLSVKGQAGDLRTNRVVEEEKWKEQDKARADSNRKKNERDDWQAGQDREAAAKEDKRKRLTDRAAALETKIADRVSDDDDDEEGPRAGRGGAAAGARRIRGVVARGSYQRDREGNAMALRASRETRDPRIAQRAGREDGQQKPDRTLEAMRKLLAEIKSELRKTNSPKK